MFYISFLLSISFWAVSSWAASISSTRKAFCLRNFRTDGGVLPHRNKARVRSATSGEASRCMEVPSDSMSPGHKETKDFSHSGSLAPVVELRLTLSTSMLSLLIAHAWSPIVLSAVPNGTPSLREYDFMPSRICCFLKGPRGRNGVSNATYFLFLKTLLILVSK